MQFRRLVIVAPLAALAGTALIAAVIASGQRSIEQAAGGSTKRFEQPDLVRELARVDAARHATIACVGAIECDALNAADRVRAAATSIERWPSDNRFVASRAALRAELDARTALLLETAAARADGTIDGSERRALEQRRAEADRAMSATLEAEHDAGLITDEQVAHELSALASESVA